MSTPRGPHPSTQHAKEHKRARGQHVQLSSGRWYHQLQALCSLQTLPLQKTGAVVVMQDCKDNSTHKSRVSEWPCKPPAACSWCKVKNGVGEARGWNLTSQEIMRRVPSKPSHGEIWLKKHESC